MHFLNHGIPLIISTVYTSYVYFRVRHDFNHSVNLSFETSVVYLLTHNQCQQ